MLLRISPSFIIAKFISIDLIQGSFGVYAKLTGPFAIGLAGPPQLDSRLWFIAAQPKTRGRRR